MLQEVSSNLDATTSSHQIKNEPIDIDSNLYAKQLQIKNVFNLKPNTNLNKANGHFVNSIKHKYLKINANARNVRNVQENFLF